MGIQQRNLILAFRHIQPETLYRHIRSPQWREDGTPALSSSFIGESVYQDVAHSLFPHSSHEEQENCYYGMVAQMRPPSPAVAGLPSVFYLLVRMGSRALCQSGEVLLCRFSEMLAWRSVYHELGQDLFTTAFLAWEDLRHGAPPRRKFLWDAILKTDDSRLNALLARGIAENHCHLGGSTQNFPLTWACLMNYPDTIALTQAHLNRNLQPGHSRGARDNVWPWRQRLLWAAHLRASLFSTLETGRSPSPRHTFDMERAHFSVLGALRQHTAALRCGYGAQVTVPRSRNFTLDYALRREDCRDGLLDHPNRLLSGERSFLYRCFRACFDGTFNNRAQDWFYLYLLIKENFRAEIVQINHQTGFYNFKEYQSRKDFVYDRFPAYLAEALRLSVVAETASQNILSFEARLAPRDTPEQLEEQIRNHLLYIQRGGGLHNDCRLFFVYHFIKQPDPRQEDGAGRRPRNYPVRAACRRQTLAIAEGLRRSQTLCRHVMGIDAANLEIGCRPEVFAPSFRYLRNLPPMLAQGAFWERSTHPHIHVTYHAGEDFLDIADGLRAIDEAVRFLHLQRGDRLGHALALGVSPDIHYAFKHRKVILQKQDFLDNMVWLLYRSQELGAHTDPQLRAQMTRQAEELFFQIYFPHGRGPFHPTLYEYYCSMQLRGDAPEQYFVLPYRKKDPFVPENSYPLFQVDPSDSLEPYRNSQTIAALYHAYHYDPEARRRGAEIAEFTVTPPYMALIREIQDRLGQQLERQGIMIECNPTSNYLIGTFRRYEHHPIFRFNNAGLLPQDGTPPAPCPQLSVSINTDDLGIFDTSLENEYAILAAALERACTEDGEKRFTSDSVYKYLDNVREMGIQQAFSPGRFSDRSGDICPRVHRGAAVPPRIEGHHFLEPPENGRAGG